MKHWRQGAIRKLTALCFSMNVDPFKQVEFRQNASFLPVSYTHLDVYKRQSFSKLILVSFKSIKIFSSSNLEFCDSFILLDEYGLSLIHI